MREPNSSQNGHNRFESQFSRFEKWQDIPVDVLREFADELRLRYTDRGVADMVGLSVAAAQDFVHGRTQPERRTLQAFGEKYLELVPHAFQRMTVPERDVLPQLKSVLPEGEDAALEYIETVIRAAEASGTLPQSPEHLGAWLRFLLQAEYQLEAPYAQYLRKRRPKGSAADAPPKSPRNKPRNSEPG